MNAFIFLDINECLIHNACPLSRPVCENIPGSYRCNYRPCQPGFVRGRDGRCRGELQSISIINVALGVQHSWGTCV